MLNEKSLRLLALTGTSVILSLLAIWYIDQVEKLLQLSKENALNFEFLIFLFLYMQHILLHLEPQSFDLQVFGPHK